MSMVAALVWMQMPAQAQTPPVVGPPADHNPADPSSWQRGEPLPGETYPWTPADTAGLDTLSTAVQPDGYDLDVTYIQRTPMYHAYCVQYADGIPTLCAGTENEKRWPNSGEVVTFTAHIINKGPVPSPEFTYRWAIDGSRVMSGTHAGLAPAEEATVTYQWPWAHTMDGERVVDDHHVRLLVETATPDDDLCPMNDYREDGTNALGLHFTITPEMYAAYSVPAGATCSYSAEDWLQRQVQAMNEALAGSTYPLLPAGAIEHMRINTIQVTSSAPINDGTHDGGWFVTTDYRLVSGGYDPATDIDWNLIHELSHQIGLIDLYNLDIAWTSVDVQDQDGQPANFGFMWPNPGIMGGGDRELNEPHTYSSHSAFGISSNKGYRRGYYGEYQFDIPQQNTVAILDNAGQPAPDVTVELYQRTGPANWVGERSIDKTPEISGTTDAAGRLILTNRSVGAGVTTRTGHTLRDNPFGVIDVIGKENRFLLRLTRDEHEEFHWLDITDFNLAYWRGDTVTHTITISSHVPAPNAPAPPDITSVQLGGDEAVVCWSASSSPEVAGYRFYQIEQPNGIYRLEGGVSASDEVCFRHTSPTYRIGAVTAVDGSGRESGFSNFAWLPYLQHPSDVGILSDGSRVVLDPQNGHALIRQRSDGWYLENIGSPHFHLEYSQHLTVDDQDRLIISHPGDAYSSRRSVRVADSDGTPLLEFGEYGTEPGHFLSPAGVAVWGESCTVAGPHETDDRTLLLLHFDGSYDGADGEAGTSSSTSFVAGRYGQGVFIDAGDSLTYDSAGNVDRTQGSVEFWLHPEWNGDDAKSHTFFEVGSGWFNRMRIMKDGANNLRFIVWDSSTEYGVAHHVAEWTAGEWHHVAATWDGNTIALYVDGQQVDSRDDANVPATLAATVYVGSAMDATQQADATVDELRISDVTRTGNSDTCNYRILVADPSRGRVLAFDGMGKFVTEYAVSHPYDLTVDNAGHVIVVDRADNTLKVLAFDGETFTPIKTIAAGFVSPHSIDVDASDHIIVSDWGDNSVTVIDDNGQRAATYTEPNDGYGGSFSQPRGVTVDHAGNIVVADAGARRVVTIIRRPLALQTYLPIVSRNWTAPQCSEAVVNGGFERDAGWKLLQTAYAAGYTTDIVRTDTFNDGEGGTTALYVDDVSIRVCVP